MMLHTRADKICQGKDVTFFGGEVSATSLAKQSG